MTLSASKCSPHGCVLNLLTVKPALEKRVSEEADVAGMQRYFGPPFHVSSLKG